MNRLSGLRGRWFAGWLARLLLMGVQTGLLVFLICRLSGWQGARGTSDALFLVGLGEIIVGGGAVWGSVMDTSGRPEQRLLFRVLERPGSADYQRSIWSAMLQKQSLAVQAMLCGLITMLTAAFVFQ